MPKYEATYIDTTECSPILVTDPVIRHNDIVNVADPPHFQLDHRITGNAKEEAVVAEVGIYSYCILTYGPLRLIVYPDND